MAPTFKPATKKTTADIIWKKFDKILSEMNAFREVYATESYILYGDIKTKIVDSDDAYFMKSQNTYEWASMIQPLLDTYLNISRAEGTKQALIGKLDEGIEKLNANQEKLEKISQSFDALTSKTQNLKSQYNIRFDKNRRLLTYNLKGVLADGKETPMDPLEKDLLRQLSIKMKGIKQFSRDLEFRMAEVIGNIHDAKARLQDEIEDIENLKSKIEPLKTVLNSDLDLESNGDLKTSAQDLITECKKNRERFNEKTKLI